MPADMAPANTDEHPQAPEMRIEPSVVEGRQRIVIKQFSLLKNEVRDRWSTPSSLTSAHGLYI
jgi:hypothetical protein